MSWAELLQQYCSWQSDAEDICEILLFIIAESHLISWSDLSDLCLWSCVSSARVTLHMRRVKMKILSWDLSWWLLPGHMCSGDTDPGHHWSKTPALWAVVSDENIWAITKLCETVDRSNIAIFHSVFIKMSIPCVLLEYLHWWWYHESPLSEVIHKSVSNELTTAAAGVSLRRHLPSKLWHLELRSQVANTNGCH